jgi:hypothetical protein
MKRILLAVAVAAGLLVGGFVNSASADGPRHHHGHHHHHHHHGHHHHGYHHHGRHHHHYGYYGRYNVVRPIVVPYGAGYSGGWQPYGGSIYVQQPRFGLYLGF